MIVDHIVAGTALTLTTVGTTKDSLNDRPISTPFYALSYINYTLAAFLALREALNGFENTHSVLLSISLAGWATGHLLNARQIKESTSPKGVLDNANTHYGYSDLTSVHVSPPPGGVNFFALVLGGAGLVRTFFESAIPKTIKKYVTAPRLYALSYCMGALGTAMNVDEAVVIARNSNMIGMQLQAAWAYINFDSGIGRKLKNTFRKAMGAPLIPKLPEDSPTVEI